ncbi:MAG: hypothetical protein GY704_05105, partial [Phycisphaeraceae bacterium]|nr:hypothetical protein [Phycisphaeraceae bacterium]
SGQPGAEAGQLRDASGAPHLSIDHARYWMEGQTGPDTGLGDGVTPGLLTLTLHNTPDDSPIRYRVVDLDVDGALPDLEDVESGAAVRLPTDPGDYRIEAYCADANLESSSGFTILAEE